MKTIPDFLNELKNLDSRLDIIPNPNRKGLSNIKLDGVDICPIPSDEIREEADPSYVLRMENGWILKHKTRPDAVAIVKNTLENIKTQEGYDNFFDKE